MRIRLQQLIFSALLAGMVSLAYGLNFQYFSDTETTVFGERIKFWHGDTLEGPVRSNDQISIMQDPQFYDYVIMTAPDFWHGSGYNPGFHNPCGLIFRAPPLELPDSATWLREQAIAQGHYFNQGDTMQAMVHLEEDSLRIWWTGVNMPFDTNSFTFHALPESAIVFFDAPVVKLWGTVNTTLIFGCAGRAGLEDNILYTSSHLWQQGRPEAGHPEKFALVAEGEVKILNTWANGRENSHHRGSYQTNPDSMDIYLNGFYFALGGSFTFDQQNDLDSGYVYQSPPGTPHTDDRGTIYLWGGITNRQRGYVHRSNNTSTGYLKQYRYDNDLRTWQIGVFTQPDVVLNPAALNFGDVMVGDTVRDTVNVGNNYVDTHIDSVFAPSPFLAILMPDTEWWNHGCHRSQIPVVFAPDHAGTFTDSLRFYLSYYGQWYTVPISGVAVASGASEFIAQPSTFSLAASPNPFNPTTEITFSLRAAGQATVTAYDILGQRIATLQDGFVTAGEHSLSFDGSELPAGIYFLRLEAATQQKTLKLVLLK